MDLKLRNKLNQIEEHLAVLKTAESHFLYLDAHRKVLAAQLFLKADGKNVAEKEAQVYASSDWIEFSKGHAQAESDFNHQRRVHELLLKKYDGEHLSLKTEAPVIRRQV